MTPRSPAGLCLAVALAVVTVAAARPRRVVAQTGATAPAPAYSVGAAFDAARQRLVLFGGYRGVYVGDTWEWDGGQWSQAKVPGPSARNGPALVYDAARRQVVLFGGDTRVTGALGDTWVYDGVQWREMTGPGPPPRSTHAMVYDSRRERVVLFGGADGSRMLGDTWEWDGRHWTPMTGQGPSARTLYGLAYDSARGRTVLFGGTSELAPNAPSHGDTWEYDGTRWTRVEVVGPSARDHVAMGYDASRRVVVLHGGGTGPVDPSETWTFDGRAWNRATSEGPRRRFATLSFDPKSQALLLFGGFDLQPSNELWRLTGTTWSKVSP